MIGADCDAWQDNLSCSWGSKICCGIPYAASIRRCKLGNWIEDEIKTTCDVGKHINESSEFTWFSLFSISGLSCEEVEKIYSILWTQLLVLRNFFQNAWFSTKYDSISPQNCHSNPKYIPCWKNLFLYRQIYWLYILSAVYSYFMSQH